MSIFGSIEDPLYHFDKHDKFNHFQELFQPLPSHIMEEIGMPPPQIKISNHLNIQIPEKNRSNSTTNRPIKIELPSRKSKSSSLVKTHAIVKTQHGLLKVATPSNISVSIQDQVIIKDGPVLVYGTVVPSFEISKKETEEKLTSISFSDNPTVLFVDDSHILVSSLLDRDKKAMLLLKLIMEKENIDFEVVFLETVSFSHRAAFHLGYRSTKTEIVQETCRQLMFLFGCPVIPLFVE